MAKLLQKSLKAQGLTFELGARVKSAEVKKDGVTATVVKKDGSEDAVEVDVILVAVGRRAYAEALALDAIGVTLEPLLEGSVLLGVEGLRVCHAAGHPE